VLKPEEGAIFGRLAGIVTEQADLDQVELSG
jgi:hypothetical protein